MELAERKECRLLIRNAANRANTAERESSSLPALNIILRIDAHRFPISA